MWTPTNEESLFPKLISRRAAGLLFLGGASSGLLGARANANPRNDPSACDTLSQDRAAVEDTISQYAMAIDNRDSAAFAACWLPELHVSGDKVIEVHRPYEYTMHNVLTRSHLFRNGVATGVTYCVVSFVKNVAGKLNKFDTYARYRDELVSHEGRWLFRKREYEALFSTEEAPVFKGGVTVCKKEGRDAFCESFRGER
jgi:hypothetical protein